MDTKSKKLKLAAIHEILPTEIIVIILKKLGYKSVSFARLTCKKLKKVIDDFGLAKDALGNFKIDPTYIFIIVKFFSLSLAKVSSIVIAGGFEWKENINFLGAISDVPRKINLPNYFLKLRLTQSMVMHMHNDLILFCGGITSHRDWYSSVNGSLTNHSRLNVNRFLALTISTNSGMFVFGGYYDPFSYEYLPKDSTTWILGRNDIPEGIKDACAITMNSEQEILLIGNRNRSFDRRILKFDVKNHTFEELSTKLINGRSGHRCAYVPGTKKIIITGGYDYHDDMVLTNSTEILDTENGTVTVSNPMKVRRADHGIGILTVNDEDRVAVFGGRNFQNASLDSVETFNTKTQKWEMSDIKLDQGRYGFGFLSVKHEYLSKINS